MNELVTIEQPQRVQRIAVHDPVPVLDTGRFDQMARLAKLMANSNLIPESLAFVAEGTGLNRKLMALPFETVMANCFLIINQAVGWGMDPFAVAQCSSVVHGRPCYEGKLIAAVLDQKLGVRLKYKWNDKAGDQLGIVVSGELDGEILTVEGTVGEWKTIGNNSPWKTQPRKQLAYRGAREWARLHRPAVILGVYSSDEMEAATDRQERLSARQPPPPPALTSAEFAPNAPQREGLAAPAPEPAKKEPPAPLPPPPAEAKAPPPPPPAPPAPTVAKAPPAPPPAPVQEQSEAAVVIPGPTPDDKADPKRLRNWFEAAAAMAETGEQLEALWNEHVEPLNLEGMDYEDFLGAYRRRERELEP